MKHYHLILELSDEQKEFRAFFQKMLKKFKVSSPAELKGEKKKEFFNAVDRGFKSDAEEAGVRENREQFIERMKSNVKLRRDYMIRTTAPVREQEEDEIEKGAASDPEISGKKSQLVIEFPNEIRVEFSCKGDEVEDIKTRAQELHDEGLDTTEVAAKVVEEFPGCTFEIQGGSAEKKDNTGNKKNNNNNNNKKEESQHLPSERKKKKKVKESFSSFMAGIKTDPGKIIRERKNDRRVSERVERQLQRFNNLMSEIKKSLSEATPKTQERLALMVKENLDAVSEVLLEDKD